MTMRPFYLNSATFEKLSDDALVLVASIIHAGRCIFTITSVQANESPSKFLDTIPESDHKELHELFTFVDIIKSLTEAELLRRDKLKGGKGEKPQEGVH